MNNVNVYHEGDMVRVSAAFVNDAGVPTDPTTTTCKHTDPAGTTTTLVYGVDAGLVRDSAGAFHVDITASSSGFWRYGWFGTGAVVAADFNNFFVMDSGF